ncbi:H(+)-transporting V0 sector ATPase subunit a [Tieghemiomyces parasiticus]|uniref:V-type proton ATPase subunit a n=1 Tax=Tieghemiomyces parasiticus TaxID=78921 RepID=A0A9W7ZSD7_9FUNG|nr:H(+)-transporting V0 sector ATPase subunit a [Tieghemiomyces parasiticus]
MPVLPLFKTSPSGAKSSLFRSEEMTLIQLYIPTEIAKPTVSELGELGAVEFRDLNPETAAFQRTFVNEIKRLDEMERKLRYLATNIEKQDVPVPDLGDSPLARCARSPQEIDEMDESLSQHEYRVAQLNESYTNLQRRLLELTEMRYVLRETSAFLQRATEHPDSVRQSFDNPDAPLLDPHRPGSRDVSLDLERGGASHDALAGLNIGFVTGVIARRRIPTFERVLWRSLRGNLYMNHVELDEAVTDPATDEPVEKNVFIIFAHGAHLLAKIRKIAESLGATLYRIDESSERRHETMIDVMTRLDELQAVLQSTATARRSELAGVAEHLPTWTTVVKKEKALFHTMNLFNYDANRKCLIAEGWCPTLSLVDVQAALRDATELSGSAITSIMHQLKTAKEPPTYHRTNKFTQGFQSIVDAYGVARYREVNPGLFTIISFPFLFAVMFGDFGHGILVSLAAGWMCWRERAIEKAGVNANIRSFFDGRYIVLLMGLFSIYTGLIYNDIFSLTMHIFPSGWRWPHDGRDGHTSLTATQVGVYPLGLDPNWHGTENMLLFSNSYKMKMSIVFGVIQMSFGIILTVFNHRYFKKAINIYCEFIPQLTFMLCLFGYLTVLIIYKWLVDWNATDASGHLLYNSPPGLLNTLIFMFLAPGSVKPEDQLYPGQAFVQTVLVLVAVVCVPWMLLTKPLLLRREHKRTQELGYANMTTTTTRVSTDSLNADHGAGAVVTTESESEEMHHDHEFEFGEVLMHQVIHTIEFCLGCISNTASYLRLWALSLAHAQLSEVLWTMVMKNCFGMEGDVMRVVAVFVGFAIWFSLTVFILLLMEGLSAFLHALRLHWVEFNNKFYEASGKMFEPFSFERVLHEEEQ